MNILEDFLNILCECDILISVNLHSLGTEFSGWTTSVYTYTHKAIFRFLVQLPTIHKERNNNECRDSKTSVRSAFEQKYREIH